MFFVSFYTETISFLILIITETWILFIERLTLVKLKPFDIFHVPRGKEKTVFFFIYKGYKRVDIAEMTETEPKTREGT